VKKQFNHKTAILSLASVFLFLSGCGSPQPSTWWGIRSLTGKDDKDSSVQTQAPITPTSQNKKKWWKPFSKGEEKPATKRTTADDIPDKDFVDPLLEPALAQMERHDFRGAKQKLLEVIRENPAHSEAYRNLGDCHYNLMEFPEAIDTYVKARQLDASNNLALRGKGFAHLHYAKQFWKLYAGARTELKDNPTPANNKRAQDLMLKSDENFQLALELFQRYLALFPNDSEATFGRAMAADGASRRFYSNAIGLLRKQRATDANAWAQDCLDIIDEGLEAIKLRIDQHREEAESRILAGALFLRRASLLKEFGQDQQAGVDINKSASIYQSVLTEIDRDNRQALAGLEECKSMQAQWKTGGGE
jgi:tetratricopeptide (TPR) repeat protein